MNRSNPPLILAGLLAAAMNCGITHAAGAADQITVSDAYIRQAPPGAMATGAFMVIRNAGPREVRVVKASNPASRITELQSSLGLAPGANIGEKGATFEAVHGSAPDIAGKNVANPIAVILSGALLLDHIGERPHDQQLVLARSRRGGRRNERGETGILALRECCLDSAA